MNEPTKEQAKKLWEWCGFTYLPYKGDAFLGKIHDACWLDPGEKEMHPDNWHFNLPLIDLNNLFKYAVPKLAMYELNSYTQDGYHFAWVSLQEDGGWQATDSKDPALALFWAIWKVVATT